LSTFIFSGLAHDLPFIISSAFTNKRMPHFTITLLFLFLGIVVVVTEKLNINFKRIPAKYRWIIHLLNIFLCWKISFYLSAKI
jgi:hypothetical protein